MTTKRGRPHLPALPPELTRDAAVTDLRDADFSRVRGSRWINFGPDATPRETPPVVDAAVTQARQKLTEGLETLARNLHAVRVIGKRQATAMVQAAPDFRAQLGNAEGSSTYLNDPMGMPTTSRQIDLEALYSMYDFVPLTLPGTTVELIEQKIYEESYLAGGILDRIAGALTEQGYEFARFTDDQRDAAGDEDETDEAAQAAEKAADLAEAEAITSWFSRMHRVHSKRWIERKLALARVSLGNAFCEILPDRVGADRKPAGLAPAITSSMRVMRGHRGYIQYLAGQIRWFNVYTPRLQDRQDGVRLWMSYWQDQGVDASSDDFARTPLSRTLSSAMPVGTWNPLLSEMVHLKGEWPRSNYYGFVTDYRLALLWPLLEYSLLYNVNLMRNNRVPPIILMWHGPLDDDTFNNIQQRFANIAGPANYGKTLLLEAEAATGSTGQTAPKMGLEIIRLSEDKDGIFLPLWEKVERSHAKHYRFPWDLLDTNSSNRATITVAMEALNRFVIHDLQDELAQDLYKPITRDDLGFTRRYHRYKRIEADDRLEQAQVHHIYRADGVLNPNEIREEIGRDDRPGGDIYAEITGAGITVEDEVSEEEAAKAAKDYERQNAAADTAAGGETTGDAQGDGGSDD